MHANCIYRKVKILFHKSKPWKYIKGLLYVRIHFAIVRCAPVALNMMMSSLRMIAHEYQMSVPEGLKQTSHQKSFFVSRDLFIEVIYKDENFHIGVYVYTSLVLHVVLTTCTYILK